MADTLQSVFDLPDVSFTDNDTLSAMQERLISNYEARYAELTGEETSLAPADPMRILLYAVALDLYQLEQYVDRAGKQDLLKYSYGEFLDNLAANRGVTRKQATAATTVLRFTISDARAYAISIPAGTRVTNGNGVYFQTSEYGEVPAGELYVDVPAECTQTGIEGNDLVPGQLNVLVDTIAYVDSVRNISTSDGGTVLETDESLAERVFLVPSSYSVAGPSDAYTYWAKTYNTDIGAVKPTSPSPGEVDVYILMSDGTIPEDEVVSGLEEYLGEDDRRPMTDLVKVKTPEVVNFDIDLVYYINRSDRAKAVTVQNEVANAVSEYITWQTSEIGRDINPDELLQRIKAAGVKRVEMSSPVFTVVKDTQVAQCSAQTVTYGGLEDD
jgi:phage-related baseplate assembly protein